MTNTVDLGYALSRVGKIAEDSTVVDFRSGKINYFMPSKICFQLRANDLKLPNMQLSSNNVFNLGEFFLSGPAEEGVVKTSKQSAAFNFASKSAVVNLAAGMESLYGGGEEIFLKPLLVNKYAAILSIDEILSVANMLRLTRATVFQIKALNGSLKFSASGSFNSAEIFIHSTGHNFPENWTGLFPSSHELLRIEQYSYNCPSVSIESADNDKDWPSPIMLSFKEINLSAVIPQVKSVAQFLQ